MANLAWGASYYWYEVSVPAPYNLPDDRVIGPITINADGSTNPSGIAVFEDPQSAIVTAATNGALPEGTITDSATLSGIREDAGGTITFRLWDNNTCTGDPIFTSAPVAVSGPGTYGPVQTTVDEAGDYYWIATYSGDPATGTLGVAGECGDENEISTVIPAGPGITTVVVDEEVTLSAEDTVISDKATLSGGSAPTGTITFTVYGPFEDDPSGDGTVCTEENEFDSVAPTTAVVTATASTRPTRSRSPMSATTSGLLPTPVTTTTSPPRRSAARPTRSSWSTRRIPLS